MSKIAIHYYAEFMLEAIELYSMFTGNWEVQCKIKKIENCNLGFVSH